MKKIFHQVLIRLGYPKVHSLFAIRLRISTLSRKLRYYILSNRYEFEEMTLCSRFLNETDSVIEVGASIGFLSLFCKKKLKIKNILVVEPNPAALSELRYNYALNNEEPLVREACLTKTDGDATFYQNDDLWEASLVNTANSSKAVNVKGVSLATLLKESPFTPTTLIIDIEGGEESIDFDQVPGFVRKLIIEIHPGLLGYSRSFFVLNRLMNIGFGVQARMSNCYYLMR